MISSLGRRIGAAIAVVAIATLVMPAAKAQSVPESNDPIVIALLEWTGQHISAKVVGYILEDMGYNVEYVTAGTFPSALQLAEGDVAIQPEFWSNNMGEHYPKLIDEGKIENAGELGLDAREGWLYPKYMEKQCPGLPAWDALVGCAEMFETAETSPNGRFLNIPAEWGAERSENIIAETGIHFEAVSAGSEGAMVAELNSAVNREGPLVMHFWAPHWVLPGVQHGWIDLPEEQAKKYALEEIPVWKMIWPGMKDTWPAAYRVVLAYQIDNSSQESMMALIDNEQQDLDEVTKAWVEDNRDVWQPWVDDALGGQ